MRQSALLGFVFLFGIAIGAITIGGPLKGSRDGPAPEKIIPLTYMSADGKDHRVEQLVVYRAARADGEGMFFDSHKPEGAEYIITVGAVQYRCVPLPK